MAENIKIFPRKIEDFSESEYSSINENVDDDSLFKNFRDRFKTWETLRAERYLC